MKTKIFTALTMIAAVAALTITVSAQGKKVGRNAKLFELVQAAKQGTAKLDPAIARKVREDFKEQEVNEAQSFFHTIIGTWNCQIAESDTGLPPFEALQTFGIDGNFVETSSLHGMGGEGPAHGSYERRGRGYVLTFELFVFDPSTGESVGRVRVRASIKMTSPNEFDAVTAVDFIEPGGNVIPDIDGGPFTGTRLQVRGL